MLPFTPDDPRVRHLNDRPVVAGGEFVVYWSQIYRRAEDNAALAYAVSRANELGLPCIVYEALRPDYPHANDRLHTFVLEGARDTAKRLLERGIHHAFFLPRTPADARGIVRKLAARAALIVSDDFPSFIVPAQNAAAAKHAPCSFVVVDDCAVVPLSLFPKEESAARTLRPKFSRVSAYWLDAIDDPAPRVRAPRRLDLPFDPIDWKRADIPKLVASCEIDHTVASVPEFPGGTTAAEARLERFLRRGLPSYDTDRSDPSRDRTSHLSPYLHFGMISARRVALDARAEGGPSDGFLEQLLVRRALAYNFARTNPAHRTYDAIPPWAKATLEAHQVDKRYAELSIDDLAAARSPDPIWNAAQAELRARGVMQNYARMLWGKLVITWCKSPARAHAVLVELNDRFALDGRDPDGYANISWCFGLHDRPWPKQPIFGNVRSMTTRSAARKFDFDAYIDRSRAWREAAGL